jgi:hypothetical protein
MLRRGLCIVSLSGPIDLLKVREGLGTVPASSCTMAWPMGWVALVTMQTKPYYDR